MTQAVTLQPMEDHDEAEIHSAAHGRPHTEAGRCVLKTAAVHGESMLEQVFLQDLWPEMGSKQEQAAPEGLHPVEVTHSVGIHEELQPIGQTNTRAIYGLSSACRTLWWRRA